MSFLKSYENVAQNCAYVGGQMDSDEFLKTRQLMCVFKLLPLDFRRKSLVFEMVCDFP